MIKYQYYFGVPYYKFLHNISQNSIQLTQAPTVDLDARIVIFFLHAATVLLLAGPGP